MYKTSLITIIICLLLVGCSGSKEKNSEQAYANFDIKNFPARWIALKQKNEKKVIFKPCDAELNTVSIDHENMLLKEDNGHVEKLFKISDCYKTDKRTYYFNCSGINNQEYYTFEFSNSSDFDFSEGMWTIIYPDSTKKSFMACLKRNMTDYKIEYQACTNCYDDCFGIFPPDRVGEKTIEQFLNDKTISKTAKFYFLGQHKLNIDYQSTALLDSLFCNNTQNRGFYFLIFNMILKEGNDLLKQYTAKTATRYIEKHTNEFLYYLSTNQVPENGDLLWGEQIAWYLTNKKEKLSSKKGAINIWLSKFSDKKKQMTKLEMNYFSELEIILLDLSLNF